MPSGGGEPSGLGALLSRACGRDGAGAPIPPDLREAAFAELMRLVMISIRAGMGRRLRDHRDSADVCQSIAKSFVDDFDRGRVAFQTEAQLAAYLQTVVRSKLADLARRDGAVKRGGGARDQRIGIDQSAALGQGPPPLEPAAADPGASADLRTSEALQGLLSQLTPEEQALVRLRRQGLSWEQIAEARGQDAATLRQQFSRVQRRLRL